MNIFRKALLVIFVVCVTMMSYHNALRTEQAIVEVEDFFRRTQTIQAAQLAADRAMMLLEQRTYEMKDMEESFQVLFERLSVEAETVKMEAMLLEQVIHGQNAYIVQLQDILKENQLPVPAQPRINLGPNTCPAPDANFFNLPRRTTPPKPKSPQSPDGSSRKNSTAHVASGTEESLAV